MKKVILLFAIVASVVFSTAVSCYEYLWNVREVVEFEVDGVRYSGSDNFKTGSQGDSAYSIHIDSTSFYYSLVVRVVSEAGDSASFSIVMSSDEPFEVGKEYKVKPGSNDYRCSFEDYDQVGGSIMFTQHAVSGNGGGVSGIFNFVLENEETGDVINVTNGTFEDFWTRTAL